MCISVNPGEFTNTYIADFPATPGSDTDRVLSYLNEVEAPGARLPAYLAKTLGRTALPNAMLFAVYGDDVRVLPADDPQASRDWLLDRRGTYLEGWEAQPEDWRNATRSVQGFDFEDEPQIVRSGNYNVGVARNVTDIPRVLAALKEVSPGKVPDVSPEILERMQRYYDMQALGIPRFVVAAFALEQGSTEDMHPITVRYNQMPSVHGKVVLPALDYHGKGEWQAYVERNHHLLFATNRLIRLLSPANPDANTPSELTGAPTEFPVMIVDRRDSRPDSDHATWAPNNDYIFDTATIEAALISAEAELASINGANMDEYDRRDYITEIVRTLLGGGNGVMERSNQPATTVAAYNEVMHSNF